MKLTQSFFQSLDEWVDYLDIHEDKSADCSHSKCTGDCSFSCIPDPDSDLIEGHYANTESYPCFEQQWIGGLQ